jgi:hypothetical protein
MHHLGHDAPALATFKADKPVAFHCPQCARQIGLGLAGNARSLVERARRLLGDDTEQLAITGRQELGERLRRGEPDLRLARRDTPLAPSTAMVRAFISS